MALPISERWLSVTPTIATGIYTAGDAVGGRLEFANAVQGGDGSPGGILQAVVIIDKDSEDVQLDLMLFSEAFTATADHDAWDPTDADLANLIGIVEVNNYKTFNDNSAAMAEVNIPLIATEAGGTVYGQLVTRGTPSYTATTDIIVKIGVTRG